MAERLPVPLQHWSAAGQRLELKVGGSEERSLEVYYQVGGNGPWLVCFHGFPTSCWDWHLILPLLQRHHRVLIFDFPGYGLSDKPVWHDYSLLCQMDIVEQLLQHFGISRFDLLCHDMGNSVACELLHRIDAGETTLQLRRMVMLNGGVYMHMHKPLLTQRLLRTPLIGQLVARFSSWQVFSRQYPKVYANPDAFEPEHYECQWSLIRHNQGRKVLAPVAGYMRERVRREQRWLGALHQSRIPCRLIWGERDPIAVHAIGIQLRQNMQQAALVSLPAIGHYPQLEAPEEVAGLIGDFLL